MEKARVIDSFGHAGLTPLDKIRLTLAGEIKMTPVEASAGEFFCSFETPCPGTAGINLKNYSRRKQAANHPSGENSPLRTVEPTCSINNFMRISQTSSLS